MLRLIYIYYGTLLPGWNTLRAFGHGQRHFIDLWLKYWVIYALLQAFGVFTDFLIGGLKFYGALKLILSICLWFSAPYSTNQLFNIIKNYIMGMLEPIFDQGDRWHQTLGRNLFRSLIQTQLVKTIMPKNQDEQIKRPRVNDHLLKRELSNLMAEIERDQADQCQQRCHQAYNLDRLDRDSMHNVIEYLSQRIGDQEEKAYPPRRYNSRIH
ncbi:uncharacterized protein [Drosophila takahashii]|uniref:uncharacterized protein n=1 Tax=Drosophila takahashii TaxID=29030 RepID=UPI001CF85EF9|nr:uncharacterized protein LOC108061384 [Drosophila takahashii]